MYQSRRISASPSEEAVTEENPPSKYTREAIATWPPSAKTSTVEPSTITVRESESPSASGAVAVSSPLSSAPWRVSSRVEPRWQIVAATSPAELSRERETLEDSGTSKSPVQELAREALLMAAGRPRGGVWKMVPPCSVITRGKEMTLAHCPSAQDLCVVGSSRRPMPFNNPKSTPSS